MRIIRRLDHVNLSIQDVFRSYEDAKSRNFSGDLCEHALLAEEVICWMRKTADELIGLNHVLAERQSKGSYPTRVDPDSIGRFLKTKTVAGPVADHVEFLSTLNEIVNATNTPSSTVT